MRRESNFNNDVPPYFQERKKNELKIITGRGPSPGRMLCGFGHWTCPIVQKHGETRTRSYRRLVLTVRMMLAGPGLVLPGPGRPGPGKKGLGGAS